MDGYIKFYAPVTPTTSVSLQKVVEQLMRQGLTRLHLLLSTPGGSVHDGISIYNFLKGIAIEVNTYNFGSVDSIGVVVFCAGTNRFSVPHARFLLHPVSMQVFANQAFDEPMIQERLNGLRADQLNIAKVIASTINKEVEHVEKLIHGRTSLDADTAFKEGLVTKISSELLPLGSMFISIFDTPQQITPGIQLIPQAIPALQSLSIPAAPSQSELTISFSNITSS